MDDRLSDEIHKAGERAGIDASHHDRVHDEPHVDENAKELRAASVALASAMEVQKPSLLSKNMLKLYYIMGIGYLVSTMNGFDSSLMVSWAFDGFVSSKYLAC